MGRRWGKTTLGTILACEGPRGCIEGSPVGWFAPTYQYLIESWDVLTYTLGPIIAKASKTDRRIQLSTGGVVDFWTLENDDAGRGRKYARAIIDEAGLVPDLDNSWPFSIRPTLTDLKGQAWFLGTPKPRRFFVDAYRKAMQGARGWKAWNLPTTDNPCISRSEIEEARASIPEAAFRQEYLGIESDDGGNPFGLDAIARCLCPALSTAPTKCFGVDLAKSQDWTVVVGLDASGWVTVLERWQGPWIETENRLVRLIGNRPALIDSTGVGDPIVEGLQRKLPNVEGFKFTSQSKQQIMEGLAVGIQREEVRYPDGVLRHELEAFGYEYTKTGVRYTAPSGLHDDCVCALALARKRWERGEETAGAFVFADRVRPESETAEQRMSRFFGDD